MSRKGRQRLEEEKRLAEEGRKRWEPEAFRMSRKRRKRLAAAQTETQPRLKRFVLQNMRMTRSRKRKMRDEAALRQTAQVASISALALLPPVASEAAGINNVMQDIPAELDALHNDCNRIRDFHEAQRNAQEAAAALIQAEQDLQMARQDKADAERGLAEARQNLKNAQLNLQRIAQELANAQVESAQRTREAIAAQQAVADFAPRVWAQESAVEAAQSRRQRAQASYEDLGRQIGHLRVERDDLEERIRNAWESVGYAQNRLNDVMAMVNRAQAIVPEQSVKEAQWQALDNQLDELDAAVDSAESLLDALNSQLDALQEAREAAEDAERDARELVRDLQAEQTEGEHDLKASEQDAVEAEKWQAEAISGVETAEDNLAATQAWKTNADYTLAHFGEGKGFSTGFEYYNWQGAGLPAGHQLYQPIEFYTTEKKWDFYLSTGWLNSDTGLPNGHISGWTDTNLGLTYKNNHKINDVHYTLNINVPTGKENAHQNAMMADNLARFNSFSEGWQFTPGIAVTHRFTERDSITGRLDYTFRGDYQYRRTLAEIEKDVLQSEMNQITNIATRIGYVVQHGLAKEKSLVWESLESQQGNVEFVTLLENLKEDNSLDAFLSYPVEYLMTYGIQVSDAVDEETNSFTEEALKDSLANNTLWQENTKTWDDAQKNNMCNALLAAMKIVDFLGYDNISEVYARYEELKEAGYFVDIDETIKQIAEVENTSADLSGCQPGVAAYLLATKNITDMETQEEINPGNKFQQELEYRHIGEADQLSVKFTHVNASHADYKSTLTSFTDDAGHVYGLNLPYGSGRNDDGEEWTLQVFGSQDIDRKNSLQYYVIGNYQAADIGGTHRYYGGLGWTHQFDKKQSGYVLLNYGETHGQSYNWRTGKYDSGRMMKAIVLGYDYRLNDTSELRAKFERYNISGSSTDSYHGWKMSLMWNKSF